MMQRYAREDARFKVIDKPNTGYGDNINIGFAQATGDYLGILESDDFAEPDFLEALYTTAVENDLDIARAQFYLHWSNPPRDVPVNDYSEDFFGRLINPSDPALAPSDEAHAVFFAHPAIWISLYKASFIRENGITCCTTPGASYQDTAFNFKVWACAKRVMVINRYLLHYRQDNEASSVNNPGKVYLVCGEYEEIFRWLHEDHPELCASLEPVAVKMKYCTYIWNLQRIAPAFRHEFAQRFQREFADYRRQGLISTEMFTAEEERILRLLDKDPDLVAAWRVPVPEGSGFGKKLAHKFTTMRALIKSR